MFIKQIIIDILMIVHHELMLQISFWVVNNSIVRITYKNIQEKIKTMLNFMYINIVWGMDIIVLNS